MEFQIAQKNKYASVHSWLYFHHKLKGSGKSCQHCGMKDGTGRRLEWALIRGLAYENNIANFIPLCASCHRKYDITQETREKMRKSATGKSSPRRTPVEQWDGSKLVAYFPFITEAEERSGVSRTAIVNNLTGRSKTAGGFTWKYSTN
jgi:hypothetical protein